MATATLINDNGHSRIYRTPNGTIVKLEIDDEWTEIKVKDKNDNDLGEFEFRELESGGYKLMRMYCTPVRRSGIGRAALEFFLEIAGGPIYTSPNDGVPRDDGSHLTENAPGFVAKMIKEGLIEPDPYDFRPDDENGFFE